MLVLLLSTDTECPQRAIFKDFTDFSQYSTMTYVIDYNSNRWYVLMKVNKKIEIEWNLKCKIETKFHP